MQRQIRFKRPAIQWEHRRVPPSPSEKDQPRIGFIVVTYTLLLEDPLYAETVLSQRRLTLNMMEISQHIRDAFLKNILQIESTLRKLAPEKSLFLTSTGYIPIGVNEADSGKFSIKSKEGATYENSTIPQGGSEKIRSGLSKFDSFFYDYALDKVRDENSRLGIKLEGL